MKMDFKGWDVDDWQKKITLKDWGNSDALKKWVEDAKLPITGSMFKTGISILAAGCDPSAKPGLDGRSIFIKFDGEVTSGDIVTFDFRMGEQLYIKSVEEGWAECTLVSANPSSSWFPYNKMEVGTIFHKLGPLQVSMT